MGVDENIDQLGLDDKFDLIITDSVILIIHVPLLRRE